MALGCDVAPEASHVERAIRGLMRVRMHRLVSEKERPWPIVLSGDELHRQGIHEIGHIAGVSNILAVVVESRVDDLAMPVIAHPQVIAGARHAVISHMPLADVRGQVAELLQLDVVIRQPVAHRVARHVVDDAVTTCVLAGHDRSAVRRADRRGVESSLEKHAFGSQPVDVRRLHVGVAARAELIVAQVIHQDDEEIGLSHARTGKLINRL
jgi:hypothetical protein